MNNNLEHMIELFEKTLVPGETCNTRILFREMDLGIVRQNPYFICPDIQIHQGNGPIKCIDKSAKVLLMNFNDEELKCHHEAFVANTRLEVRTIFFKNGKSSVRLYNNDVQWTGDRHRINLLEFLKRCNELDGGFTIQRFEAILFGVV